MKKILLLFGLFCLQNAVFGQNFVQIGTSTSNLLNSNTAGGDPGPIFRASAGFNYGKHHYVITATELSNLPANAVVTGLAFYKGNNGGTVAPHANSFDIYVKNSSLTEVTVPPTFFSTLTQGASLAYSSRNQVIPAVTGYVSFNFTTPFVYTGGALEISTDWALGAPGYTTANFNWSGNTVSNRTLSNPSITPNNDSLNNLRTNRPTIRIFYSVETACAAAPQAGNAVASVASACFGKPFYLDLSNHSFTPGYSYQWQSSIDNINFTDISGATAKYQPISQTNNTLYYRCIVSCGALSDTSSAVTVGNQQSLSGNFTLDPSQPASATNFISMQALVDALRCASVSSNVRVDIAPGTYNGNFYFHEVQFPTGTNLIINGNGLTPNDVVLRSDSGTVVSLTNSANITFNNLRFERFNIPALPEDLLMIGQGSSNINVINCQFKGIAGNTTANNLLLSVIGASNVQISSSTFDDGYYGIWGQAVTGVDTIQNLQIIGNFINNSYLTAINVVGVNKQTVIASNVINNSITTVANNGHAINITNGLNFTVNDNAASGTFGITAAFLSNANGDSLQPNLFYNNAFALNLTSATPRALHITTNTSGGLDWVEAYHNSFNIGVNSTSSTQNGLVYVGPLLASSTQSIARFVFKNNTVSAFSNNTNGTTPANLGNMFLHATYLTADTTVLQSSHNHWHFPTAVRFAYVNSPTPATTYATLADFQLATGNETATLTGDPLYTSASDLRLTPASPLGSAGTPISLVTTDLLGNTRSLTSPSIGAYELIQSSNNAVLASILTPVQAAQAGATQNVSVRIRNFGNAPLTSLQLNYRFDNGSIVTENFSGNLAFQDSTDFTFTQSIQIPVSGRPLLEVWTALPNGSNDSDPTNDSLNLQLCLPLAAGTYSLGGSNSDFSSFQDLNDLLSCAGISGPVVIQTDFPGNISSERLELGPITGASQTNTLTFEGNNDTLAIDANTTLRYLVLLNGAKHVTIRDFVLKSLNNTFGIGVILQNYADSNRITNNLIDLSSIPGIPTLNAINNALGIVSTGSLTSNTAATYASYNLIDSNTIIGGHAGIRLNGSSGSEGAVGNRIIGNTIAEFGGTGIHLSQSFGTEVAGNIISRANRVTTTTFYGINLETGAFASDIHSNRIHSSHTSASSRATTAFGIRLSSVNPSDSASGNRIYNNLVYELNTSAGNNGILLNNVSHADIAFNTFDMASTLSSTGASRGAYFQGTINNVRFINNHISQTRIGSGSKQAIGIESLSASLISDRNNYFVDTANGSSQVGLLGAVTYTSLADWQAAGSGNYDALSTAVDPNFVNIATQDYTPQNPLLNGAALSLPYVTTDINGSLRDPNNPDIGAFEFVVAGCNAPIQLAVDSISLTSAQINWQSTNNLSWNIEYGPAGFTPGSGTILRGITSKPYTLSNLSIFTCYDVYVQDSCIGQTSSWSGPLSFCTLKDIDLRLVEISSPADGACTSNQLPATVVVRNEGTLNVSSFSVQLNMTGAATGSLTQTFSRTILPGDTAQLTLGNLNTQSGGLIQLTAVVNTSNDRDIDNDSLNVSRLIDVIINPVILSSADTVCSGTQVLLRNDPSTGAQNIGWFDAQGNQIGSGDSLLTTVNQSTTIGARVLGKTRYSIGPADSTFGNAQAFSEFTVGNNYLRVQVLQPIRLRGMRVYPNRSGNIGFVIRDDATNAVVLSQNIPVSQTTAYAPVEVAVDINLSPGIYRLSPTNNQTAGGMVFNNSGATFPYGQAGVFTILGTNSTNVGNYYYFYNLQVDFGSCPSPLVNKNLVVRPAPVAAFTVDGSASPTYSFNASTSTNAQSFEWNFGDGTTAQGTVVPKTYSASGTYAVRLIAIGACGRDTTTQNVQVTIGSSSVLDAVNRLNIYPNPNNGQFVLEFEPLQAQSLQLVVRDMQGRQVYQEVLNSPSGNYRHELDLRELASGVYYLSLEQGNRRSQRRLVIQGR